MLCSVIGEAKEEKRKKETEVEGTIHIFSSLRQLWYVISVVLFTLCTLKGKHLK